MSRNRYGLHNFAFDVIMVSITAGLWLIWIFVRETAEISGRRRVTRVPASRFAGVEKPDPSGEPGWHIHDVLGGLEKTVALALVVAAYHREPDTGTFRCPSYLSSSMTAVRCDPHMSRIGGWRR